MCGKSAQLLKARVEDAVLKVCKNCSPLGEVLQEAATVIPKTVPRLEPVEIAPDFQNLVKTGMKEKKLSRKELAEKIKEKETVIERIERGMRPTKTVAEKLEKALDIASSSSLCSESSHV